MPNSKANTPRFIPPNSPEIGGVVVPSGRWGRGTGIFSDEALRRLKFLLDEANWFHLGWLADSEST